MQACTLIQVRLESTSSASKSCSKEPCPLSSTGAGNLRPLPAMTPLFYRDLLTDWDPCFRTPDTVHFPNKAGPIHRGIVHDHGDGSWFPPDMIMKKVRRAETRCRWEKTKLWRLQTDTRWDEDVSKEHAIVWQDTTSETTRANVCIKCGIEYS